jgi:hypothetical protein
MFHDILRCFYSRIKISKRKLYTILMHISPPFKQMNFVFETYISELPNICSTCSKFVFKEPTCLASPFVHKDTPTWNGSKKDLFIRIIKYATQTAESYIAALIHYDCEATNRKISAVHYLAAQFRKSPESIQGYRRKPAKTEFPRSGSKQRSQIKDTN